VFQKQKQLRRRKRRVVLSHVLLTSLGVPRHKDGNRLGLRKRTQMAEKAGILRSAGAKENNSDVT
jgi:hypothetical protein